MARNLIPYNFITKGDMKQQDLVVHPVPLTVALKADTLNELLPATAGSGDMGLVTGTPGTNAPTIQGTDFGGTTQATSCAILYPLPIQYVIGESVVVRVTAGMLTTVSDGTATLDLNAYSDDGDGTVSADLCTTTARNINITAGTLDDFDFTINSTSLEPGDLLQLQFTFGGSDTGNAGVMIPRITRIAILLDRRAA